MDVAGIKSGADFVERGPFPGEFDVGCGAIFADAGDSNEFAASYRNGDRRLGGFIGGDLSADAIDTSGSEDDVPARRRRESG